MGARTGPWASRFPWWGEVDHRKTIPKLGQDPFAYSFQKVKVRGGFLERRDPSPSSSPARGLSLPTHFPRAQAPPRGRSREAARRLAAEHSLLLSAHGQLRLGDCRTEPGPGAARGRLGRAGEFLGYVASFLGLTQQGMAISAGR